MTGHAKETMSLWDSLVSKDWPTKQQLSDWSTEPPHLYPDDPHAECVLCPICEEAVIGRNGCTNGCTD